MPCFVVVYVNKILYFSSCVWLRDDRKHGVYEALFREDFTVVNLVVC